MEVKEPTSTISAFTHDLLIGNVAKELSTLCEFPLQTANLITIGLVSHVVQLAYCSMFKHYRALPCGLYVASEQGKAASKSPLFDGIKGEVDDYISEWNKEIIKMKQKAMVEYGKSRRWGDSTRRHWLTSIEFRLKYLSPNPTPEALERYAGYQGGVFSVSSTEKTVLSVLFGGMYADGGNQNLELPLSGFVGEKPKVLRISRDGITCRASGAITILSQPGTVQSILEASSNTGLSERFLMLIEPRINKQDLQKMWEADKPYGKTVYENTRQGDEKNNRQDKATENARNTTPRDADIFQ